jgi:hypothetical protein
MLDSPNSVYMLGLCPIMPSVAQQCLNSLENAYRFAYYAKSDAGMF